MSVRRKDLRLLTELVKQNLNNEQNLNVIKQTCGANEQLWERIVERAQG